MPTTYAQNVTKEPKEPSFENTKVLYIAPKVVSLTQNAENLLLNSCNF